MKSYLLFVALCTSLSVNAQQQATQSAVPQTTVQEPASTQKTPTSLAPEKIRWKSDDPNCDKIAIEGTVYRIIKHKGLLIAAAHSESKDFYANEVMVINNSERRVLVEPEQSLFVLWSDEKKPGTPYAPLAPEKVAGKIENRARWANALRTFGAAMATNTQTVSTTESGNVSVIGTGGTATGVYNGSSSSTVTTPDQAARRKAENENASTSAKAQNQASYVVGVALKANTVMPQESVHGHIYFPHKKFISGLFVLKIENTYYEFAVAPQKR